MTLPTPVLLYDQPRAPNPMRLNLFLAEKSVSIPRKLVDLMANEHKSQEYLDKVGQAICPALELSDGSVLTETVVIARYVEALHPEPNMFGTSPQEMAEIEMWQRRVEFGLWAAAGQCFRHTNPHLAVLEDQVPEWGEINRSRIEGHLRMLDDRLAGRDYLAADRMTIADVTAFVAMGFTRIIKYKIPEGLDNLSAWRDRIAARPSSAVLGR
ncbi:MAG: glutathione binding-like protein [Pseudomonadota bacterium]